MIKVFFSLILIFLILHIFYNNIIKEGLENKAESCEPKLENNDVQPLIFKNSGNIASLKETVNDLKSHIEMLDSKATQAFNIAKSNQEKIEKGTELINDSKDKIDNANSELEKISF